MIRVALIGFGLGGESFHAPLIACTPGLTLTTIVTTNAERRERARRAYPQARLAASADEVWKAAGATLCRMAQLNPDVYDRKKLLERFMPKQVVQKKVAKPVAQKPVQKRKEISYTIQKGDSLWSISKKFGVPIERLKKHNKLESDALKPGNSLMIPASS